MLHRIICIVLLLAIHLVCSSQMMAQDRQPGPDETLRYGEVYEVDTEKPVNGLKIKFESGKWELTNKAGEFSAILAKEAGSAISIELDHPCYNIVSQKIRVDKPNVTTIYVKKICNRIQGIITNEIGNPIADAEIILLNFKEPKIEFSDFKGEFQFLFPVEISVNKITRVKVNGELLASAQIIPHGVDNSINLIIPDKIKESVVAKDTQATRSVNREMTETQPVDIFNLPNLIADREDAVKILVLDMLSNPLADVELTVDDIEYKSNEKGEVFFEERKKYSCIILLRSDYSVANRFYDRQSELIILNLKEKEEFLSEEILNKNDSTIEQYARNITLALNEAEIQKQKLIEDAMRYEKRMEDIKEKLESEKNLTPEQISYLRNLLVALRDKLIQNNLEFEDVAKRTGEIIESMRIKIERQEQDLISDKKLIAEGNQKISKLTSELFLAIGLGIFLLVAMIFLVLIYRKSQKQRKQLVELTKELEKKIDEVNLEKKKAENALNNVRLLSDIGQNITATLDFKYLHQTIHANVNSLLDATIFGIGVTNTNEQKVEFMNYIEAEEIKKYVSMPLKKGRNLISIAHFEEKNIIINDLEKEYNNYLPNTKLENIEELPKSLLFMPLSLDGRVVGIITLQSYQKNAYQNVEPATLESLSTYISVAFDNSRAYDTIKSKNQSITDSIRYAKTIQYAFLPHEKDLAKALNNYFVLYKAKDIVSGDFYWCHTEQDGTNQVSYAALVDCTGHGVPGAFMSIIGLNLLHEIIIERKIQEMNMVLNVLNEEVINALKQTETANNDGMDVAICKMTKDAHSDEALIQYAGAKRPMYIIRKDTGILEEVRGTRKSVGGIQRKSKDFAKTEITAKKGDLIYMTTDGFADQNSFTASKIGSEAIKEKIISIHHLPLDKQKEIFESMLKENLSEFEQRDDISILAFEV